MSDLEGVQVINMQNKIILDIEEYMELRQRAESMKYYSRELEHLNARFNSFQDEIINRMSGINLRIDNKIGVNK